MAKKYGIGVGLANVDEVKSDFLKLMKDLQSTANNNKIQLMDKDTLKQMEEVSKSVENFKSKTQDIKVFDVEDIKKQKIEVLKNITEVKDKIKNSIGEKDVVTFENMKMDTVTNDVKSFVAVVSNAEGQVQKLAYELVRLKSGDKVVGKGFVNTDKILTDTRQAVKAKEELIRLEKEQKRISNHQEPKTRYYDVKTENDDAERFRTVAKLQKEIKERNKDAVVSFTTVEDSISNTITKVVANIKRGSKEAETLNYELMKIRHFDEDGKKTTSYNGYVQTKETDKTSNDAFALETQKKLYSELNSLIKEEYSLKVKLVGLQGDEKASGRINAELEKNKKQQDGLREVLTTKKLINVENEKEIAQNINKGKLQVGLKEDTTRLALQKKTYSELNALIKEEYALKVKLANVKDNASKDVLNGAIKANKERQSSAEQVLKTEKLINGVLEEQTKKTRKTGENNVKLAEEKVKNTSLKNDGSLGNLVQYDIFRRTLDATFHKLKEGVGFVVDFNKSLTEISVVTGKNQDQVASLGREYVALGKSMKVSSTEVAQASVEYYRQGLAQTEVDSRMKQTIQFSKVANVGLKDSAEILTATVNSMEIDMKRATDVFTFMGDATATGKLCPLYQ